jgi:hypothetical protein
VNGTGRKEKTNVANKMMIQHMFQKDGFYKTPDGKRLKIVTSEVWNLRAFEIADGHMTGPMLKIHPESDLAKSLVEIE